MDNGNSDKKFTLARVLIQQDVPNAHNTQEGQDVQVTKGSEFKIQTKAERRTKQKETPISKTTQGKKGEKLPRINMAFSSENHEYLQIISRIENTSQTNYVNKLVEKDRTRRADEVEKAKSILKT